MTKAMRKSMQRESTVQQISGHAGSLAGTSSGVEASYLMES